jgi:hypothetical protein
MATATGGSGPPSSAIARQIGGGGGGGVFGANGGAGASSTLTSAVGGSTNGGELQLYQDTDGGNGGDSAGGAAGKAGAATSTLTFDDTKNATQSTVVDAGVAASGGGGGFTDSTGSAATAGGASKATIMVTSTRGLSVAATAGDLAQGDFGYSTPDGGNARGDASGGAGGAATASATGISTATQNSDGIEITAGAVGGNGGYGNGIGNSGGAGGIATATAFGSSAGAPNGMAVSATATGGNGGEGGAGAKGGAGGSSSLTNAVSGYSNRGALWLTQTAVGGNGGNSDTGAGGKAGSATSTLNFNDTTNATQSYSLKADVFATGGTGGTGATNAAGGAATASLTLTGAGAITAYEVATGGAGSGSAGPAAATTTTTGLSGTYRAEAATSLMQGKLVQTVSADAEGSVDGTSTAQAAAKIGGNTTTLITGAQAVALETGAPSFSSTKAVLDANVEIKRGFGASPVFFALSELGGEYSTGGVSSSQTTYSEIDENIDLTKLVSLKDLAVGLYNGVSVGSGVTGVTLDVYANGTDLLSKNFGSGSAAQADFTDQIFDLGALSGNYLSLKVVLTVTTTSPGSGFFGDIIIGDPPSSAARVAGHQIFAQAIASLASPTGGLHAINAEHWGPPPSSLFAPKGQIV